MNVLIGILFLIISNDDDDDDVTVLQHNSFVGTDNLNF